MSEHGQAKGVFVIDVTKGMVLSKAARELPSLRQDKPVHSSTLIRWILHGVNGPDGQVVRLEAVRLGGHWITDADALNAFAARLTPAPGGGTAPQKPNNRRLADELADRELERRGL